MCLGYQGKKVCDTRVAECASDHLLMARPTPHRVPVKSLRRFVLRSDRHMHSFALSLPFLGLHGYRHQWTALLAVNEPATAPTMSLPSCPFSIRLSIRPTTANPAISSQVSPPV